jgi:hypothetical protein
VLGVFIYNLLVLILILIIFKILFRIVENVQRDIIRDMKYNKLKKGVISRKDFASFECKPLVKSKLLYVLAGSKQIPTGMIPYNQIYEDNNSLHLDEFVDWCDRYLEHQGYTRQNIISRKNYKPESKDSDVKGNIADMIYLDNSNNTSVYVQCILLKQSDNISAANEDNWPKVGRPDMQKAVGSMAKEDIYKGIIITTGDITDEALEYANTLPKLYLLEILQGHKLAELHRKLVQ